MKTFSFFLLMLTSSVAFAQKFNQYNKFIEVKGTGYVIASVENSSKAAEINEAYFEFVNTKTGKQKRVDFTQGGKIGQIMQVKIDSLNLNKILVFARTVDIDQKAGIDWTDPTQVFLLSIDGESKTQVTKDDFYLDAWIINNTTGALVITGYYDLNKNKKQDKDDKTEIIVYNLRSSKRVAVN